MENKDLSVNGERARYRILTPAPKGFFGPDDHLYQEGEDIYFDGEPNEEMEPLNESARIRLIKYLEKLDGYAKVTAEKLGRPFVGRPRNEDGAIALAREVERANMSIMGGARNTAVIEKAEREEAPETGTANPKRGRGRPKLQRDN